LRKGSAAAELYVLTAEAAKNSFAIYKAQNFVTKTISLKILYSLPSIFADE
jgi:hypothetical protein